MKKHCLPLLLLFTVSVSLAQDVEKTIDKENITRIIKTLSADDMMGRPAARPELIEPATRFIENEFRNIGLKPLPGLKGFRQEFEKQRIEPLQEDVTTDGAKLSAEKFLIVSDRAQISLSDLPVQSIVYDTSIDNANQYFFGQAFKSFSDTSSVVIMVSPEFAAAFQQLKGYFGKRFVSNRQYVKVFILSDEIPKSVVVTAKQKLTPVKMTNVVGMLEGTTNKNEMVIFSGHYDHIGIQQPVNGDSIANGADDDASGTTAVIALANYFKKANNNSRSIVFVAFTAEEIGGYGSKYFSQQLDPDKVVAMFNIEMIGKPSKWGKNHAFLTGYDRSDFGEILAKNLEGTQFRFEPDPYPEQDLFYRSDNATLARLGVPAHSISTDQINVDKFYHTVDDEFETLDMDNLVSTIRALALSAKSIIDGTDTPTRIDKATVR